MPVPTGKPTFFKTQDKFRNWLQRYASRRDELWVGFHKTHTNTPSITWPQSVDQALCFGWIDGIRKSIDESTYMIRFTPRRKPSIWSAVNIRRFEELKAQGLITPDGQRAFDAKKKKHTKRYSFEQGTLTLLPEYEKQLKKNKKAWTFFQSLPPSVKKPSIWFVMSAKKESTRVRRLETLIDCCVRGERLPQLRRPGQ